MWWDSRSQPCQTNHAYKRTKQTERESRHEILTRRKIVKPKYSIEDSNSELVANESTFFLGGVSKITGSIPQEIRCTKMPSNGDSGMVVNDLLLWMSFSIDKSDNRSYFGCRLVECIVTPRITQEHSTSKWCNLSCNRLLVFFSCWCISSLKKKGSYGLEMMTGN